MKIKPITDPNSYVRDVVARLLATAGTIPPQHFKAFVIGGLLGNLVGSLPEEYWQEFRKSDPCDQPNCDCHVLSSKVMPALEALRRDYLSHCPKNN